MTNLAPWAHSDVFNFLAQPACKGILRETYMSNRGLIGYLRQL